MGLQSVGFFADRHDMFGAMAGMGAWFRCIYRSDTVVRRNRTVHRQRNRASLFDDRRRRESIV